MTTAMSVLEKSQISHLSANFAELHDKCKRVNKDRPAYERWSYRALDTIASYGGYISFAGALLTIKFMAAPLLIGTLGIGALTVAAYALKKLIFGSCVLHMNLPQERTKWWGSVDFFDALEKRVMITLDKYTSKLSVSQPRFRENIESKLNILNTYIDDLEKNHPSIEGFGATRIAALRESVQNLKISVIALKALSSLKENNKTEFEACKQELLKLKTTNQMKSVLQFRLDGVLANFERAREVVKTLNKNTSAIDVFMTI